MRLVFWSCIYIAAYIICQIIFSSSQLMGWPLLPALENDWNWLMIIYIDHPTLPCRLSNFVGNDIHYQLSIQLLEKNVTNPAELGLHRCVGFVHKLTRLLGGLKKRFELDSAIVSAFLSYALVKSTTTKIVTWKDIFIWAEEHKVTLCVGTGLDKKCFDISYHQTQTFT